MKVYVVNCYAFDEDRNLYCDFMGTEGVWSDKYHAKQWVVQQTLKDKENGDDCMYDIKEFNL
ncbi:MAG: hypothetical protein KBT03_13160 [Bacteroidales bacterium]|nr:hypothetical protein [Candidatus Scybalousia scybalohippi]